MNQAELHESILASTTFAFSRSGGHGGQIVNKLNTKVQAAIEISALGGLSEAETTRVRQQPAGRISANTTLSVSVQDERTQERNKAIALQRLEKLVVDAARIPKRRKKTRPTAASRENRLSKKRLRSYHKQNRSWKPETEN